MLWEPAWSEQATEAGVDTRGLLEGRRGRCGRCFAARRGRVRRPRRQGAAAARGIPPWRAGRSQRNTGDHRQPEAMPTLPVRRAIHTGMRTWPTLPPYFGWKPIPTGQTTVAEILSKEGFGTYLVTDTYVQFRPGMNFGRGFGTYQRIRGQERDTYKDPSSISEEEMRRRYLILGEGNKARQYLANVQGRRGEEDWFAPRVFSDAM